MEIIKYTDSNALKYALSKFLTHIDSRYLTDENVNLILYKNENMPDVTNVKEGLDSLIVGVAGLNSSIEDLRMSDNDILNQAMAYTNSLFGSQMFLEFIIVDELPTENISGASIYLVPVKEGGEFSHYNEYLYVYGEWEFIGTTNVNLSDYYTKKEINEKIDEINLSIEEIQELTENKADNLFKTDMNTVTALGGIPANTNLNNMSIQDILTKLLYPYVSPSVSASITYTPTGGIYELGQIVTVTKMTINVTKKSENITKLNYYVNGNINTTIEAENISQGGSFTINFTDNIAITKSISNSYFQARVTDASGRIVTANTTALNFYYPYYYGVINEGVLVTEDLIKGLTKQIVAKGNKTYTFNPNNQRIVIAYPKSYGSLKSILDPNGFEQLAAFTCIELNVTGLDGIKQKYFVYYNNASTNTNFTMKFNY